MLHQYIFFTGFFLMLCNEIPVVSRHVYAPSMQFRKNMEKKFGEKWHQAHTIIDYIWTGLVFGGIFLASGSDRILYISLFSSFWLLAIIFVYIPLYRRHKKKSLISKGIK